LFLAFFSYCVFSRIRDMPPKRQNKNKQALGRFLIPEQGGPGITLLAVFDQKVSEGAAVAAESCGGAASDIRHDYHLLLRERCEVAVGKKVRMQITSHGKVVHEAEFCYGEADKPFSAVVAGARVQATTPFNLLAEITAAAGGGPLTPASPSTASCASSSSSAPPSPPTRTKRHPTSLCT
jgi:hypothetical protein